MKSGRLFAAALALVLLLGPAKAWADSLETTQANIHFNLALRQYQAQKLDDARASLAKALGLVPAHPQANLLLGLIACQQTHYAEAVAPLKLAAAGLPNDPNPWNNLGVAYFQLGKLDEAADAFKQVLLIKPNSPETAMNLGVLDLRQKRYAEAQSAFGVALKSDPGNLKAWLGQAEAADGSGDSDAAIHARQMALTLQGGDKGLREELGQHLYQAGRLTEAAEVLSPLQGSGDAEVEFLLGVLAYRRGDFDGSRLRFMAALAARPDYPEARFNLAITDYDQGQFQEALNQFQAVLDKHPGDEEARKNLDVTRQAAVRAWLKQGSEDFLKADYIAALEHWRKALELDKDNKVVKDLVDTAQAQLKLQAEDLASQGKQAWDGGNKEAAIQAWASALQRDPGNSVAKGGLDSAKDEVARLVQVYGDQAKDDLSEGRWDRAREQAARVAALDKSAGKSLLQDVERACHGRYSAALKEADEAGQRGSFGAEVEALQRAVEAEPEEADAQLRLNQAKVALRQAVDRAGADAQVAEKQGHFDEAAKLYRRVLEFQPSDPAAKDALKRLAGRTKLKGIDQAKLEDLYYQGVYAYAAGEVDKAESYWKKVLDVDPHHQLAREALERSEKRSKALRKG